MAEKFLRKKLDLNNSDYRWQFISNQVSKDALEVTQRLAVFGGWIVRTTISSKTLPPVAPAMSQCFVPDPNHDWML
jgi:hypothetical protein